MDAGNVPKYKDFGKAIFRNLNGTDTYNRVDKINVNNLLNVCLPFSSEIKSVLPA